jgi:hypothetical protein
LLIAEVADMRSKFGVCLSAIGLLSILVVGCGTGGGGGGVPIKIENADHVGAMAFNLLYDSTVLEVTGVSKAALVRDSGSTARWAIEQPGQLYVVVEKAKNNKIDGDGTLVEVKFRVLNASGSSTLAIRVLEARSGATGEQVETQVSEGSFSASDMSIEAPVISFG